MCVVSTWRGLHSGWGAVPFLWLKFVGTRFDFIEAFSVASISKPLLLYEPGYFFIDAPVPHVLLMELLVIHGLGVL